jgi:hypothetical protein
MCFFFFCYPADIVEASPIRGKLAEVIDQLNDGKVSIQPNVEQIYSIMKAKTGGLGVNVEGGHVKKKEHFTSHGMREISDGYGKHLVIVYWPLPNTPLKDTCDVFLLLLLSCRYC